MRPEQDDQAGRRNTNRREREDGPRHHRRLHYGEVRRPDQHGNQDADLSDASCGHGTPVHQTFTGHATSNTSDALGVYNQQTPANMQGVIYGSAT